MAKVIYRGKADVRTLAKHDLDGVEDFSKTSFARNEPTEISNEAARALIESPNRYGKFELQESDSPKLFENEIAAAPAKSGKKL